MGLGIHNPPAHTVWQSILTAPEKYWTLSSDEHRRICNGCGSARSKFDFVPDTVWGLAIRPACNIHDAMYFFGETLACKEEAERTFLNNMLRLIERETTATGRMLKPLRRRRALKYYEAVTAFGGPAFWEGKRA